MSRKSQSGVLAIVPTLARALALSAVLGIAACGQKGPLYLPDEEPPAGQSSEENDDDRPRDNDASGG